MIYECSLFRLVDGVPTVQGHYTTLHKCVDAKTRLRVGDVVLVNTIGSPAAKVIVAVHKNPGSFRPGSCNLPIIGKVKLLVKQEDMNTVFPS